METILIITLFLVLASEFVNGWTDAPNAIATVVATRVISPSKAVLMAMLMNIAGALSGTAVAKTIGKGIVDPSLIDLKTISAALIGLVVWSSINAKFGKPTSESHALISGLAGAGIAASGFKALLLSGWIKVFIGLFCSSFLGFFAAFCIGKIIQLLFANSPAARSRRVFDRLQIFSAAFMAYNHGLNDGQKFIGVFTIALVLGHKLPYFTIPLWVIILCAGVMGIGTSIGGWRIINMLGEKMVSIKSWQGFSAELASSGVILCTSFFGIPLSTTHTITTSIMGSAASLRMSDVRWKYVADIVVAWLITFPVCGIIAYAVYLVLKFINF